ncbi:MAG: CotH kinase family protein, partial [Verrucomicrobia bacterium]|nr:CotH kinase family protein [Verrucomicrobiota bacterium]
LLVAVSGPAGAAPVISEFLASNQGGLLDEDGEASDWIEIHNPDASPVALRGWSLSDTPGEPARWVFPDRTLGPGEFLVVFASGKNRGGTGPLHTNFRLEAAGEYLGLFAPGARIATSEFAPTYPAQEPDVSYGLPASGTVRDLLAGAPVSVLVPDTASALAADWTSAAFLPGGGWFQGPGLGVGYDATPSGPGGDVNRARTGTALQTTTGFGLEAAAAIDGDPDTFTHTDSNDNASAWWVDLGAVIEVRRVVLRNRTSCCQSRLRDITVELVSEDGITVVWRSALLNPENQLASPAAIEVDLFALNVGPVPARTVRVVRTPDPDLSGGGGNDDEDNVLSLGEVEVYGVDTLSYGALIRTDLAGVMPGRNASAFLRIPFVLDDPEALRSLKLQWRVDDGLVVHLNGQSVMSRNASGAPEWNSTALAKRDKSGVFQPEVLDLEPWRSSWRAGTNWLAIQGLNAGADDPEFLVEVQLLAEVAGPATAAFLNRPTPGAANDAGWNLGRVADTRFSVNRGRFTQPFALELTTETPGAEIWYTLDGSAPAPGQGLAYGGPIRIERTTVVRAAAFRENYRPTDVDTHTYLFLADVVAQPPQPAGFPPRWASVAADYAMDSRITGSAAYRDRMADALSALPSLALTTETDNLFGATRGIYANPERSGVSWERPISMEWIEPEGTGRFQVNCGLRIQGGYFRDRNVTQKHSLRLLFKDEYGPGRLREDLFREFGAAREFDTLVLRAGANDGYAWDAARDTEQFIRDEFGRRLLLAMGQPSARGRFVHLYLNGLYWGLYNLTERPAEDFSATYLGGEPEDWDAINSGEAKNGDLAAWNAFITGVRGVTTLTAYQRLKGWNPDGSRNLDYPEYFDGPNYMDYMLANLWGGNWDWPNKNFWFGRHRGGLAGGFKFYLWDFENTMGNNRDRSPLTMVSPRADIAGSWVGEPHNRLRRFSEYRMEFADRVQRHLLGSGPLTPGALVARYRALADTVETAVIAETARWGDDHHSPPQDLTDWQRERDWILGTYLPQRSGIVLNQLRAAGLYPTTAAPVLNPAGGPVSPLDPVRLSITASELLYTTNGVDPRLPGGGVHPDAIRVVFEGGGGPPPDPVLVRSGAVWRYLDDGSDPGPLWNGVGFDDSAWKSGPSPLGYGDGDEATVVSFVDADPATGGVQRNAATWFRTEFQVSDPAAFERLRLTLTYDDGAAVFLNGVEVLRTDTLPSGAGHLDYATGGSSDNAQSSRDDLPSSAVRTGRNVLAVQVHQSDPGSSDISFDLALDGIPSGTGQVHTLDPFFITRPTLFKVRAREGTEWSALVEGQFLPDVVPASSNHIVVSEFCYRPADAATPAELAVTSDRDDFEFVELMNVGSRTVDLTGLRFSAGILFNVPSGTLLGARERVVVVKHPVAFAARHGSGIRIAGVFDGNLSNSGEELVLQDAHGLALQRFHYLDRSPWPSGPNRNGYSLVLVRPESVPDHRDPRNWRTSLAPGGTPGGSDAISFSGNPDADTDGNGQADLLDHALGADPGQAGPRLRVWVETVTDPAGDRDHLMISLPRRGEAEDAVVLLETADRVEGPWSSDPSSFVPVDEVRTAGAPTRWIYRRDPA